MVGVEIGLELPQTNDKNVGELLHRRINGFYINKSLTYIIDRELSLIFLANQGNADHMLEHNRVNI